MQNYDLENVDCHATLAMIEKRWGFPRRTLRALLGMTKSGQSGRSMIEMLGVLAIIGVLSVGGIAGYSKAMTKYRVNKTIEQITLIAGNVRSFFAPQSNYSGVNCSCNGISGICESFDESDGCPVVKKAKILPDEMITLDPTGKKIIAITNPFGGWVELQEVDKAKEMDYQTFMIVYKIGDNTEACIELLTHDWTAANVGFIGVWDLDNAHDSDFTLPAAVDKAVEVCSHAGGDTHMRFYFDVDVNVYKTHLIESDTWY